MRLLALRFRLIFFSFLPRDEALGFKVPLGFFFLPRDEALGSKVPLDIFYFSRDEALWL
jgi:hypothetical protein